MEHDEFVDMFRRLAVVGTTYTQQDYQQALSLSAALQRFSSDSYKRLLHAHSTRPILVAYSADGWGASVSDAVAKQYPGSHLRVCRNGRYRHEFLLQRVVYRIDSGPGSCIVGQIFSEPVGLKEGKTALHCFAGCCEFLGTSRFLGHVGISTSVYVQDGALHTALSRLFQSRHALYYTDGPDLGFRHAELENTDWIVCLRCVSHCASSSVKWGLSNLEVESVVDNIFISIAGLRNSSSALMAKVNDFILKRVRFSGTRSGPLEHRLGLWRALDVSPELLDQFAEADFVWDGHDLIVSDELQDQKDSYEKIATLLLHCIHWASFSLTRWVKVGQSARLLFRSLLCGVAGLVDLCRQDKAVSMYHLNGFFRAQEDELRYLAVAAFCTYPCESFLAQVMADDRILRFCAQVKGTIDEELHFLKELPTYVWHRIARHVSPDFQSEELRHLVLEASYKSVGYVHKEVFSLLE